MQLKSTLHNAAKFVISITTIITLILAGCGGGGGASSGPPTLPSLITVSAIVDVNGDGKNDVIIGAQDSGYASDILLINNGDGSSFTKNTTAIPPHYLGANGATIDIQTGDFNKDGNIDLLTVTVDSRSNTFYQSSQIHLFLGKGDGTFSDATGNITSGAWPAYFATIVWPALFSNSNCRNWSSSWTVYNRVADIDGDGYMDFVTSSSGFMGGTIYLNDGTGRFAPASMTITGGTNDVTSPIVLSGIGNPPFSGHECAISELLVGDLNNDGKPDLVSANISSESFINQSTPGNLSFMLKQIIFGDSNFGGVLIDINGDGLLDYVGMSGFNYGGSPMPVHAAINDGTGIYNVDNAVFLPAQPGVVHPRQYLAADLNGDGKQDLLISDHGYDQPPYPGARNWLLLNNGAGKLVDVTATNLDLLPGYTHQSSIGDLNGDGKPDIILNNNSGCDGIGLQCANEPRFWLNDGTGKFTSYDPTIQ